MFQEGPSLLGRYKMAKDAGFKAVECAFPYEFPVEDVCKAKEEAGLQQVLINAYPGDWGKGDRGLAALPDRKADFEDSIKKSVEYAKKLDCKRIHVMSGTVDKEVEENLSTYINNLKIASQLFEENDIVGVIEPINSYSMPNYYLNSYCKAKSVLEIINSPNLKLQLDLFHMQQICGNLSRNIQSLFPYIGHIQIAQVPARNEPNTPGEIDYKYIFNYFERLGYDGWIGLEYTPKAGTVEGLSWISQLGYLL
ncbi:UNVERIFIED_CONTAM: hypothetical protein PYX00_007010 [Menopon gallinae]|uniref:Putative hydroxypyruvate isomerase n=1 Tax=Menopon gallinae TaxID=328185 RepID=A0AAW2HH67_9NEOP